MIPIFNQSGKLCGYTGRCYLKDEENKCKVLGTNK